MTTPGIPSALFSGDDCSYIFQPTPIGNKIQCKVIRRHDYAESLHPVYELYLEGARGTKFHLLSARRKKKTKGSTYLISLAKFDSGRFDEQIVAKVKYCLITSTRFLMMLV